MQQSLAEITLTTAQEVMDTNSILTGILANEEFSAGMQRYLLARAGTATAAEACRLAGISFNSVKNTWRYSTPGFREAEEAMRQLSGEVKVQLARAILRGGAPLVAYQQLDQAAESHRGKSGQELISQQKARDAVLKGAGVSDAGMGDDVERVDLLALRIIKRRQVVE
jgi:hypothetical protein